MAWRRRSPPGPGASVPGSRLPPKHGWPTSPTSWLAHSPGGSRTVPSHSAASWCTTDDLALTLYYTSVDITDITRDPAQLAELAGTYEAGSGTRLTQHERDAIPLAMARQPLWSIAVWVALLDSQATARRHLAATAHELTWALQLADRITELQDALASSP